MSLFLKKNIFSEKTFFHFVQFQIFGHIVSNFDFCITMLMPITIITTLTLFLYCYFAKMATESFLNIDNYLFESNWQQLPVASQKYFILMIASMQKPIYYHGFGIAILNLETYASYLYSFFF